jgi:hypothetical protein
LLGISEPLVERPGKKDAVEAEVVNMKELLETREGRAVMRYQQGTVTH